MATTAVYRTGRSARIDAVDWSAVDAPIAGAARRIATVSTVASPIVVEGRLWGTVAVSASTRLPPDTEERLGSFTTLVATAIANGEARDELLRVADEQAALRRVATLVAKEATSAEVFAKVAEEAANVIGGVDCALCRDEGDRTITTLAAFGAGMLGTLRVGERFPVDGSGVVARARRWTPMSDRRLLDDHRGDGRARPPARDSLGGRMSDRRRGPHMGRYRDRQIRRRTDSGGGRASDRSVRRPCRHRDRQRGRARRGRAAPRRAGRPAPRGDARGGGRVAGGGLRRRGRGAGRAPARPRHLAVPLRAR